MSWSKAHRVQTRPLGCYAAFDDLENKDIKTGSVEFDHSDINRRKFQEANCAWRSLVTTSKGVAFDIVKRADSPSDARRQLTAYYQVECVCEQRRLQREFGSLKEPGDDPKKFTLKVDKTGLSQRWSGQGWTLRRTRSRQGCRTSTKERYGSWTARLI